MVVVQELALDVADKNAFKIVQAKQYDENSRFLKISIFARGEDYIVEPDSTALLGVKRADGENHDFSGEVNEDGTITVPLPNWMLQVAGQCICSISIIKNGERLSTLNFIVLVEASPTSGEDLKEDENYDVLIGLIANIEKLDERADSAARSAEAASTALQNAQEQINSAQALADKAEQSANEAEQIASRFEANLSKVEGISEEIDSIKAQQANFADSLSEIEEQKVTKGQVVDIVNKNAITQEEDPTVPSWAKEPEKPTYTAEEVGALPSDTQLFSGDYNDLLNKPVIPNVIEATKLYQHIMVFEENDIDVMIINTISTVMKCEEIVDAIYEGDYIAAKIRVERSQGWQNILYTSDKTDSQVTMWFVETSGITDDCIQIREEYIDTVTGL